MCGYEDRFDEQTYDSDEPVSVGWAEKPEDVEWVVHIPESLFARAQRIAEAYALHQLPTIDPYGTTRINKQQSQRVCDEIDFILGVINDDLLANHLRGLRRAFERCTRSPFATEVVFAGP